MSKYMDTKTGSLEESILGVWQEAAKKQRTETNKNDKSDDGEGMDKVQPKAVKKKFDDRKDKDIDNDGDTDSSDEFLHKKRKAISKAISKDEGNAFGKALKDAKEKGDKTFVVAGKKYNVTEADEFRTHMMYDPKTGKGYEAKTMEDHLRMKKMGYDHKKPNSESFESQGEADWNETVSIIQKKQTSMREALAKVWGFDEGHNPFKKEEKVPKGFHRMPDGSLMKDSDMDKKENKTMTGKSATKVTVDPDMKKD